MGKLRWGGVGQPEGKCPTGPRGPRPGHCLGTAGTRWVLRHWRQQAEPGAERTWRHPDTWSRWAECQSPFLPLHLSWVGLLLEATGRQLLTQPSGTCVGTPRGASRTPGWSVLGAGLSHGCSLSIMDPGRGRGLLRGARRAVISVGLVSLGFWSGG